MKYYFVTWTASHGWFYNDCIDTSLVDFLKWLGENNDRPIITFAIEVTKKDFEKFNQ